MAVLWPVVVAGAGAASYLALKHEAAVTAFFGTGFAASALLSLINLAGAQAVRLVLALEGWHPRHTTNVRPQRPPYTHCLPHFHCLPHSPLPSSFSPYFRPRNTFPYPFSIP